MCQKCGSFSCGNCDGGGLCQNLNSTGLLCNQPIFESCSDNCGCPIMLKSSCCYYDGSTTSCLGITTNTTLTNVIKKLDQAFCTIVPPSGVTCTGIVGQTGRIKSTAITPSGNQCSAYNIDIDPIIINQITNNTTNISNLYSIVGGTVSSIVSSTLTVSGPTAGVVTIDYTPPAITGSGILYSDYTDSTTLNTSWTTVKTYPIAANTLTTNGDKIIALTRFTCVAPVPSPGTDPQIRIQFNGVTVMVGGSFAISNLNMVDFELSIIRTSNTAVVLLLKSYNSSDFTGSFYASVAQNVFSYIIPMAGLNLTTNSYSIDCDIKSAVAGDTINRLLEVEYKAKI